MRFEIKEIQRVAGATILYVTHDQEVAMALSDRLAVMDERGKIHQIDTPEHVYTHPVDMFVFKFLGISNMLSVKVAEGTPRIQVDAEMISLPFTAPSTMEGKSGSIGFRPMDVEIAREKLQGTLEVSTIRVTLLGPIVDYLFSFHGIHIRAQALTDDAISADLIFDPGETVYLTIIDPKWFDEQGVAQQ